MYRLGYVYVGTTTEYWGKKERSHVIGEELCLSVSNCLFTDIYMHREYGRYGNYVHLRLSAGGGFL